MKKKYIYLIPVVVCLVWAVVLIGYYNVYGSFISYSKGRISNSNPHNFVTGMGTELNFVWYRLGQLLTFAITTTVATTYGAIIINKKYE